MSSKGSPDGSDDAAAPEKTEWSANGVHTDVAEAVAEPQADDVTADEPVEADAADVAAEADASDAPGASPAAAPPDEDGSAFLSELVRAMQTTATAEKARVVAETDRRREEHLAAVEARRLAEATSMLELADTDLKAIDSWAEDERHRIQTERERRATALQADLEASLATHGAKVDDEIKAVEAAIAAYRVEVGTFFAGLDAETDPIEIARHASRRPAFPVLEAIGVTTGPDPAVSQTTEGAEVAPVAEAVEEAPAAESTESTEDSPAPVAVMEPLSPAKLAESWAAWSGIPATPDATESEAELPAAEATDATEAADEAAPAAESPAHDEGPEPIPLAASAVVSGKGRVLQSVPSSRPMSWLRRDRDGGDGQNADH